MSAISDERITKIRDLLHADYERSQGYTDGSNPFQNVIADLPEYDAEATAAAGIPEHLDEYILTDGTILDLNADSHWRFTRPATHKQAWWYVGQGMQGGPSDVEPGPAGVDLPDEVLAVIPKDDPDVFVLVSTDPHTPSPEGHEHVFVIPVTGEEATKIEAEVANQEQQRKEREEI